MFAFLLWTSSAPFNESQLELLKWSVLEEGRDRLWVIAIKIWVLYAELCVGQFTDTFHDKQSSGIFVSSATAVQSLHCKRFKFDCDSATVIAKKTGPFEVIRISINCYALGLHHSIQPATPKFPRSKELTDKHRQTFAMQRTGTPPDHRWPNWCSVNRLINERTDKLSDLINEVIAVLALLGSNLPSSPHLTGIFRLSTFSVEINWKSIHNQRKRCKKGNK